jgi:hypothetical protein
LEILSLETSFESTASRFDARSGPFDDYRFGDAGHLQNDGPFDGGACADRHICFVIARKSRELDVQRIRSWRHNRESELPPLVRGHRRGPADQRR